MPDPNAFIHYKLDRLKQISQFRTLPEMDRMEGKYIFRSGKKLLNFSSNDYLGLSGSRTLESEFLPWIEQHFPDAFRLSASSSRLMTGNHPVYQQFEAQLSAIYQKPALLFNSGYHANVGVISSVAGEDMVIFADKLVHASIIDGIILSRAPFHRFRHNDMNHLEFLLKRHRNQKKYALIITESVFSMDGDVAHFRELIELKNRYHCLLMVDEAHAVGIYGEKGQGKVFEAGVENEVDILIGTLGKALASLGAFVITTEKMKEYFINTARTLIFSTALPPVQVAWSMFVLNYLEQHPELRQTLRRLIRTTKQIADTLPLVNISVQSQIIPVMIGENQKTLRFAEKLMEKGMFVWPIRPPTVPKGTARIRISLNALMTVDDIQNLFRQIHELNHEI
jgi:8-amino-7-oxononanoate synthase